MLTTAAFKRLIFIKFYRLHAKSIATSIIGLLIGSVMISGCTMVGPDYVKPEAPQPDKWLDANEPEFKAEDARVQDWWTVFHDPVLNKLIQTAYQQNLPLQIADFHEIAINDFQFAHAGASQRHGAHGRRTIPRGAAQHRGLARRVGARGG